MELLKPDEIELSPGCIDTPIENGCIEDDLCLESGGQIEEGIFKAFNNIQLNQLEIDRFACFLV